MAIMIQYSTTLSGTATFIDFPKNPSSLKHSYAKVVTNSNRTVGKGALLHTELLGIKHKFVLTWNYMTPAQYEAMQYIQRVQMFLRIKTPDFGILTMYGGDLSAEAIRTKADGHIVDYKNVTWDLIER